VGAGTFRVWPEPVNLAANNDLQNAYVRLSNLVYAGLPLLDPDRSLCRTFLSSSVRS
jgi:hypothetical protein